MAEQQPQKRSLAEVLGYAEQIAAGVDAKGNQPGAEGFDSQTAPDGALRWCASILKIVIARVGEHQEWTRKAIAALRAEVFGKPATDDSPAVPGVAALRGALNEAMPLLREIIERLPPVPPAGAEASAEPSEPGAEPSAPAQEGNGASEPPAPSMADEMAAKLAEAISPPAPVVPIKPRKAKGETP